MRPSEFSDEEIIQAGLELQATGKNITGFSLRQRVGGGSAGRLRQVWTEYANSISVAQAEPVAELPVEVTEQLNVVSTELSDRLRKLAANLNDQAIKSAQQRVTEVMREAAEQRTNADRELADASLMVDDLEEKLDAAIADCGLLRTRLDESNAVIQKQAIELAQLKERLTAAETMLSTTAELLKVETAKASQAREEAARWAGQVDMLERQTAQLTAKLQLNDVK